MTNSNFGKETQPSFRPPKRNPDILPFDTGQRDLELQAADCSAMQATVPAKPPNRARVAWEYIWKSAVSGLCGSTASTALMYFKSSVGILPSFQPYEHFRIAAGNLFGHDVHPNVLWLVSFFNGSTAIGLFFGYLYPHLPGGSGASKGMVFGVCGWLIMNLLAFPLVGLGLFATAIGQGLWPSAFSLAMLSTYSVAMGLVYAALERTERKR